MVEAGSKAGLSKVFTDKFSPKGASLGYSYPL